ncbi:Ceramide synthase 1 [Manis javanica]|nr:Ceramide synthase 1 [Manis javanica]
MPRIVAGHCKETTIYRLTTNTAGNERVGNSSVSRYRVIITQLSLSGNLNQPASFLLFGNLNQPEQERGDCFFPGDVSKEPKSGNREMFHRGVKGVSAYHFHENLTYGINMDTNKEWFPIVTARC